jgi:hypothetical protein
MQLARVRVIQSSVFSCCWERSEVELKTDKTKKTNRSNNNKNMADVKTSSPVMNVLITGLEKIYLKKFKDKITVQILL